MVKKQIIVALSLVLCSIIGFTSPVSADGLTVYGGKIETSINAGDTGTYTIEVQNTSNERMDIAVEVKGYGMSGSHDFVVLDPEEDSSSYTAREFINVTPSSFSLDSTDKQDITVTVKIPSTLKDGGRYAIVFIHTIAEEATVATISGIAARVLLTINPLDINHESEITSVDINEGNPLEAVISLKNNGNHHYKPQITGVLQKDGIILGSATIESVWPLIPEFSRNYTLNFSSDNKLPTGQYDVIFTVKDETGNIIVKSSSTYEIKEPYVPPPAPASITVKPDSASTLQTEDGRIAINFPAGSVLGQADLALRSYPPEQLPSPPTGYTSGTTAFRVDGLNGLLAKPATLKVQYSTADLEKAANNQAKRLVLARWDESSNQWVIAKTKVDSATMSLTAETNQFGLWSVMAAPPSPGINWTIIGSIIALVVIVLILGVFFLPKKKKSAK